MMLTVQMKLATLRKRPTIPVVSQAESATDVKFYSEQHLNRLHLFLPLRKVSQEPAKIWISQSKDVMTRLSFQERLL